VDGFFFWRGQISFRFFISAIINKQTNKRQGAGAGVVCCALMNKFKFGRLGTLRGDSSNASGVPPPAGHLGSSGSAASGAGGNSSASGDHHSRLPEGLANLATVPPPPPHPLNAAHLPTTTSPSPPNLPRKWPIQRNA
jgi:hypothetical protein